MAAVHEMNRYLDGLVQERCNSIANALELRLSTHRSDLQMSL